MRGSSLYLVGFVTALLLSDVVGVGCPVGNSVGRLCSPVLCPDNTVCRVKSPSEAVCSPQATCLKCVPKGVDNVCNRNHYYYAVLTTLLNVKGKLTELKCNISAADPKCPEGSTCLPDGDGNGTCCYGKGYPPPGVDYVQNNHTICPNECGGCAPNFECKLSVNPCLIYPCPVEYRCVKKERQCPIFPAYVPDDCVPEEHKCESNANCTKKLLCCSDRCGVMRCMTGFY